jgi:hypothetical protein
MMREGREHETRILPRSLCSPPRARVAVTLHAARRAHGHEPLRATCERPLRPRGGLRRLPTQPHLSRGALLVDATTEDVCERVCKPLTETAGDSLAACLVRSGAVNPVTGVPLVTPSTSRPLAACRTCCRCPAPRTCSPWRTCSEAEAWAWRCLPRRGRRLRRGLGGACNPRGRRRRCTVNTTTSDSEHRHQQLSSLPAVRWLCYGCAACGRAVRWRQPLCAGGSHLFALGLCRVRGAGRRRSGAAAQGRGRGCEPRDAALLERRAVRVPWQPACKRPPRRGPYLGDERPVCCNLYSNV